MIRIYHYNTFVKILTSLVTIFIIIFGLSNVMMLVLLPFVLVIAVIINLWAIFDSTTLSEKENVIEIKVRNRLLTDNYKIQKKNILRVKIIDQGFVNRVNRGSMNQIPIGSVAAFDSLQSDTKAYKKAMIAIQTKKRVIRIGKAFNDNEIRLVFNFLKKAIKN